MSGVEIGAFTPDAPREIILMPDITALDQSPRSISPAAIGSIEPSPLSVKLQSEFGEMTKSLESAFIERLEVNFDLKFKNMKDTSVVPLADGRYLMFVSVNEGETQEGWKEWVYVVDDLDNEEWKSLGEVNINGIDREYLDEDGVIRQNTLCASGAYPGGILQQERCFDNEGRIHWLRWENDDVTNLVYGGVALSPDLEKGFRGMYDPEPVSGLGPNGGVVDKKTGKELFYMSVTTVGEYIKLEGRDGFYPREGAISLAVREDGWEGEYEMVGNLLTEYQIPGHIPTKLNGEWVPEGGKIIEIDETMESLHLFHQSRNQSGDWRIEKARIDMQSLRSYMDAKKAGKRFLHYFTAFLEGLDGERQRGFLASSNEITDAPTILGELKPINSGETGHGTFSIKTMKQIK